MMALVACALDARVRIASRRSEWELERGVVLVDAAATAGHHVRSRDREILHAHTQGQAEEQTE